MSQILKQVFPPFQPDDPPAEKAPARRIIRSAAIPAAPPASARPDAADENDVFRLNRVIRPGDATWQAAPIQVEDFSEGLPPRPEPGPDAAEAPAPPEAPSEEDTLRARWRAEWEAEQEEVRREEAERIRAAGYADGYRDAQEAFDAEVQALRDEQAAVAAAFEADAAALASTWQDVISMSEPLLASLAFEMTHKLLRHPLTEPLKGIATGALSDALDRLAGEAPIEVSLHPVEYLRLQEAGIVEQLSQVHPGLRWEPNADLEVGDWVAASPKAAFRRLERELVASMEEQLQALQVRQEHEARQRADARAAREQAASADAAAAPLAGPDDAPDAHAAS